jgi:hypothetical protein
MEPCTVGFQPTVPEMKGGHDPTLASREPVMSIVAGKFAKVLRVVDDGGMLLMCRGEAEADVGQKSGLGKGLPFAQAS